MVRQTVPRLHFCELLLENLDAGEVVANCAMLRAHLVVRGLQPREMKPVREFSGAGGIP